MDYPYRSNTVGAKMMFLRSATFTAEVVMNKVIAIGIDLAKNIVSVHGQDEQGKAQLKKSLKPAAMFELLATMEPCKIGMEACSGAHDTARRLKAMGHDARIMAPKYVLKFRQKQKNDANDAEAICEALLHRTARFVPIKSVEQQAVLCLHRIRAAQIHARTNLINEMRGLLTEFGVVMPKGRYNFQNGAAIAIDKPEVPELARQLFVDLHSKLRALNEDILSLDRRISAQIRLSDAMQRVHEISGVGEITASAVVATVGNATDFKNGRQFAAWLGLVPRQYSTGGHIKMRRITKQGDQYLRTLLVHGARSVLINAAKRSGRINQWVTQLIARRGFHKACIAMAAKNARIIWAVLARGETYRPDHIVTMA
jgi:transposase